MTQSAIQTDTFAIGNAVVTIALNAGPRILSYSTGGPDQLFADLRGEFIRHPSVEPYHLIGGHRLWRAPEVPTITYQPDDKPVKVRSLDTGIELVGEPDGEGVVKVMTVTPAGEMTVVDHTLRNEGSDTVTTAAWAITQFSPGGIGVLPQANNPADRDGVVPNRSIVLWPYTNPSAPDVRFGFDDIRIKASSDTTRSKIGTQNARGWIAYLSKRELFVKWSPLHDESRDYPDRGSSVECYRNAQFMELETLGPTSTLHPGDDVHHREVWQIIDVGEASIDETLRSLAAVPEAMDS